MKRCVSDGVWKVSLFGGGRGQSYQSRILTPLMKASIELESRKQGRRADPVASLCGPARAARMSWISPYVSRASLGLDRRRGSPAENHAEGGEEGCESPSSCFPVPVWTSLTRVSLSRNVPWRGSGTCSKSEWPTNRQKAARRFTTWVRSTSSNMGHLESSRTLKAE